MYLLDLVNSLFSALLIQANNKIRAVQIVLNTKNVRFHHVISCTTKLHIETTSILRSPHYNNHFFSDAFSIFQVYINLIMKPSQY